MDLGLAMVGRGCRVERFVVRLEFSYKVDNTTGGQMSERTEVFEGKQHRVSDENGSRDCWV